MSTLPSDKTPPSGDSLPGSASSCGSNRHASLSCSPQPPPLLPPPRVAPRSIRQLLYPVEDIPRSALVKGTFEPVSNVSPVPPPSSLLPTKVGFLHITDTRVSTGSLVSLKSDSKVKWKWRVLEVKGNSLVLLLTDRLHPRRLVTRSSNVKKVWPQKVPLFSIDGKSHSPRTWGEPPVDKVMMIWDTRLSPPRARPLLGEECWRVMSLPSKDIHTLLSRGASKDDIGALAGNSIPAPIIVPSAAPLVDRIRAFDALTAAKSNSKVPIMNPRKADPAAVGSWARLNGIARSSIKETACPSPKYSQSSDKE